MEIILVTNRTLREENERLRFENRSVVERNSVLVSENIALTNRNHNLKQIVDELLKEKEILAYRAASAFIHNYKKESDHEK